MLVGIWCRPKFVNEQYFFVRKLGLGGKGPPMNGGIFFCIPVPEIGPTRK